MKLSIVTKIALIGLKTNKTRSLLTVLGIVIAVASIMTMMSVGKSAESYIVNELSGLGSETFVVRPGKEPSGPTDLAEILFTDSLKERELEALQKKENVPDIVDIMPLVVVPGSVSYEGDTFRADTFGGDARFFLDAFNLELEEGRLFTATEIRARSSVAIIGDRVKRELFGDSDAIGKQVKIRDRNIRVIGVYKKSGQVAFLNIDDTVIVPYTTAQTYLLGINHFNEFIVRTTSADVVDRAARDTARVLRDLHNITDLEQDDFNISTQAGLVEQVSGIINALTAFLSSVVAIALVVGGVGVMNIMLVSVTERTREIGLRKAIGATNNDVLKQFLAEAIILTALGGLLGILLGGIISLTASILISNIFGLDLPFAPPYFAAFLGIFVSAVTGVIFGLYPAKKAALLNPIDALRYE